MQPRPSVTGFVRIQASRDANDVLHYFTSARWWMMAPAMASCVLIMMLISRSVPTLLPAVCMAAAAAACAPARLYARLERRTPHDGWQRYGMLAGTIVLPMVLFGFGLSHWAFHDDKLAWDVTVNVLVILVLSATALLESRLTSIIAATIGLWGGGAVYTGSPTSMALLVLGAGIGFALAMAQARHATAQSLIYAEREREQRRAEQLLHEYEQTGQGWFWETDRLGRITYVTERIAGLLGKTAAQLEGCAFTQLFLLEAEGQQSERTLVFHLNTRSAFQDLDMRAADDGQERWWSISGRPVLDQFNNFMGFRGSGTDLTEKRRSQLHATQLARFDSLTGLANRFQMSEWLEKILASPRVETRACAVFLLDLDRFKQVNDTMGHPAGDALLKQVAQRLGQTVGDRGRVGRLGGDEFQVVLHGAQQREGLAHLARRIIENLSQPYVIDENARVTIGASVGIALCPDDGVTSEALIRNADLALYAAKGAGRGRHHFYDDDLHSDAKERQQLEQDLRDAIGDGALELHYQPQVRTTSERITGFEALMRWNHPVHGYMSPAKFVPVAEETGLVSAIGEWALRTACRDLAAWPDDVRVAVNVSPLQFANPALPAIVTSAIAAAGIHPSRLELEITESVFLNDDKSTEAMFGALKAIGVRLALDDFGTGYSSLGYLKKAPFDKIKIDQSFVRGATVPGSRNGAIIASIVSLAEALGMETTAEGVETLDELDLVRLLGCSHVQGYIYDRALTVEAVARRLEQGLQAVAEGPRSARLPRQTMLRKVVLEHGDHTYDATIRNISRSGAMIEGLWNVPEGTDFGVRLAEGHTVVGTARWCQGDRVGVQFAQPLELDDTGAVLFGSSASTRRRTDHTPLRRTA